MEDQRTLEHVAIRHLKQSNSTRENGGETIEKWPKEKGRALEKVGLYWNFSHLWHIVPGQG